jgi:hypothetical protein
LSSKNIAAVVEALVDSADVLPAPGFDGNTTVLLKTSLMIPLKVLPAPSLNQYRNRRIPASMLKKVGTIDAS